ncbi:alpha-ketoglutarate-dependent dioxygenase abh1-like [Nymphaea colorata]|nr:alpha-ketoglutarate-dependent dioxygenase abh1-like [Nymphaea colorata]
MVLEEFFGLGFLPEVVLGEVAISGEDLFSAAGEDLGGCFLADPFGGIVPVGEKYGGKKEGRKEGETRDGRKGTHGIRRKPVEGRNEVPTFHLILFLVKVKIVAKCRELGKESGGFYQPSFSFCQMHLHMMSLGKNWDPDISKYGDICRLPDYFKGLVQKVLQVAQEHLKNDLKLELPETNLDICIANFYSKSGKLGLHQDKDESPESILNGLPVVSFSLGDSADFLFGGDRNVDKAEKCRLDSGDVLIFGGNSRRIFHGVPTLFPDTAPERLLEQSKLWPGRLNLTFRQ